MQEQEEQALEQGKDELLLHNCPDLDYLDLEEDEMPATLEHRMLM